MAPWKELYMHDEPYDTKLGSAVMYELSAEVTQSPPPTQLATDARVARHCPMLMFPSSLSIGPPKCGIQQGYWDVPGERRQNILRWDSAGSCVVSNINLAVDSEAGNGTLQFMSLEHQLTWTGNTWKIHNCNGKATFTISRNLRLTQGGKDYFEYVIAHANGTDLAKSNMLHIGQNSVNITSLTSNMVVAEAQRHGKWTGKGWRNCTGKRQAWDMTFPGTVLDVDTPATSNDLRIISAVTVTLVALMDEVGPICGSEHISFWEAHNLGDMLWFALKLVLICIGIVIVPCCFIMLCHETSLGDTSRLFCLRLQLGLLPQKMLHVKPRTQVIQATWGTEARAGTSYAAPPVRGPVVGSTPVPGQSPGTVPVEQDPFGRTPWRHW